MCAGYYLAGPDSSEASRLMAAWVSVNIVALSGMSSRSGFQRPGESGALHIVGFCDDRDVDEDDDDSLIVCDPTGS